MLGVYKRCLTEPENPPIIIWRETSNQISLKANQDPITDQHNYNCNNHDLINTSTGRMVTFSLAKIVSKLPRRPEIIPVILE